MRAKKENKSYRITTEQEKQRYLKEGYDIYDEKGNLLEYSPTKKIAYSKYAELLEENKALRARIESETASAENDVKKNSREAGEQDAL